PPASPPPCPAATSARPPFPTRRSSDLDALPRRLAVRREHLARLRPVDRRELELRTLGEGERSRRRGEEAEDEDRGENPGGVAQRPRDSTRRRARGGAARAETRATRR